MLALLLAGCELFGDNDASIEGLWESEESAIPDFRVITPDSLGRIYKFAGDDCFSQIYLPVVEIQGDVYTVGIRHTFSFLDPPRVLELTEKIRYELEGDVLVETVLREEGSPVDAFTSRWRRSAKKLGDFEPFCED